MASDREILEQTNILQLQTAARLAGLRWKSGAPGFDKAGIIAKLEQHPSIMRAALAVLSRQGKQDAPNPFAADIADEVQAPAPAPAPAPMPEGKTSLDSSLFVLKSEFTDYRTRTALHLGQIQTATQQALSSAANLGTKVQGVESQVSALREEIKALRPVQFTINGVTLPVMEGQQHVMFPQMVKWLALRDVAAGFRTHVLLVGPASSGKTSAAVKFARLMGLELYAQPLSMDSFAVVGYTTPDGKRVETEFTRAWTQGGVFLWDEISMSAPESVGVLNSALANGFLPIPGLGTVKAHPDFYCIAGDNSDTGASLKYGARSLLDGASLDRFVRLDWQIDPNIETSLAGKHSQWLAAVRAIRAEIDKRDIAHVGATMRAVITGCAALDAGNLSRAEILNATCRKGVLCDQWDYFRSLQPVQAFLRGV